MKYLNLINGKAEADMLRILSRPANDFKYETAYQGRYVSRRSRITDRINRNFSALKKFCPTYKARHQKMFDLTKNFYEPFLGLTPSETIDKFYVSKPTGYPDNLVKATITAREIFGLNNINIAYDYLEVNAGSVHVTYDVIREPIETFGADELDPLAFSVNEWGLPEFVKDDNVIMTIFLPISFLKTIFTYANEYVLDKIRTTNPEFAGTNKEANVDMVLRVVAKVINIEIKNCIIMALYKDRFRELILSQLFCIYNIIDNEVKDGGHNLLSPALLKSAIDTRYNAMMRKFKLSLSPTALSDFNTYNDSLVSITNDLLGNFGKSSVDIWTFFYALIDLGKIELEELERKLGLWKLLPNDNYYADPNYLNISKGNEFGDVVRSTILLNRIVPFVYYTENIIGNGSKVVELSKFNGKLERYINNDLVPCAAKYHRLHRNSLSYLIDKLRHISFFYNRIHFKTINSKIAMVLARGKEITEFSNESFAVEKIESFGFKDSDYMAYINSCNGKGSKTITITRGGITLNEDIIRSFYSINDKQKHKAPRTIEEMFELVQKGYYFYIGYNPCRNIKLSTILDDETVLEGGNDNINDSELVGARKAAVEELMNARTETFTDDDMKSNPLAVIGNVSFIGVPGTPFAGCEFVYNRKTGNLVLDSINRGIYHDMNEREYREAFDFYKKRGNELMPQTLWTFYKLWESFGTGNRFESPEEYIMTREQKEKYLNK